MIPKVIHYCWFGGAPLSELAKKCISSWEKFCPDYRIVRWDESNYDIKKNQYMYEAYSAKKYGFVPDYARLDIIYNHGGIYLDTDVELIRSLDSTLKYSAFLGYESTGYINLGQGFGAIPRHALIKECLTDYNNRSFLISNNKYDLTPSPVIQTKTIKQLQIDDSSNSVLDGVHIYDVSVLCPKNYETGEINITNQTLSIHHFDGSWLSEREKYIVRIRWKFNRVLNQEMSQRIACVLAIIRFDGWKTFFTKLKNKLS